MSAGLLYILDGHRTVPVKSLRRWTAWAQGAWDSGARQVGDDYVPDFCRVSTVFLGVNHNWNREAAPLLFETMVFDWNHDALDEHTRRCPTWEQAELQHQQTLARMHELAAAAKAGSAGGTCTRGPGS